MPNNRTRAQEIPTKARHRRKQTLSLLVILAALTPMTALATVFLFLPPEIPAASFTWVPSALAPVDTICVKGFPCLPSCADVVPNSICAEFSAPNGYLAGTCCIPEHKTFTSDPLACIVQATIDRNGGGPLE